MVELQRLTGMRPGEVRSLRPIDVERSENVWLYRPSRHKTQWRGKERVVAIGPKAQAVLAPFLDGRAPESFAFSPGEAMDRKRAEMRAKRRSRVPPSQRCRRK